MLYHIYAAVPLLPPSASFGVKMLHSVFKLSKNYVTSQID